MTIAIVATFAAKRPATPVAGGATEEAASKADFASVLLALPAAAAKPAAADDVPPSSSETELPDASATGGDPAFLATLDFAPPPPAAVSPASATRPQLAAVPATRSDTPPTPAQATATAPALDLHGSQQEPVPAAPAADRAAKLADPDFAAALREDAPAGQPVAATGGTLAATLPAAANATANLQEALPALPTPLRDPSWADHLGQKLLWFAGNEKQFAQLTLHPPQLGSVEVTLNIDQDRASAHFVSLNAEVRGAIEAGAPRLREMFASAGIDLGQVSVGSETSRQAPDGQRDPSRQPRPLADKAILGGDSAGRLTSALFVTQRGQGMIDTFA